MKDQSNITIVTSQEFCVDEPDYQIHVNEQGEFRELKQNCSAGEDNHTDQTLINEMLARKLFDDVSVLDLGCAGAGLILDLARHPSTNICIGIDGSPGVFRHPNWHVQENRQVLRFANLVERFEVQEFDINQELSPQKIKFDYITCYEVIEHFKEDQLDTFFTNVKNHLKDDGIFFGSIALFSDIRDENGWCPHQPQYNPNSRQYELHKTVFETREPWDDILDKYFNVIDHPWSIKMRNHSNSYYFACEQK